MKINLNILSAGLLLATAVSFSSCDDFLTRDPQDTVTDVPSFWNNEENLRTSFLDYYTYFFPGYRSGWNRADNFAETNVADWTDDNAQEVATLFTKVAPTTDADNWDFEKIRNMNLLLSRIQSSSLGEEAKNHWSGVARLFRAMEYAKLVQKFGDVPYYDAVVGSTDNEQLYRARDPRTTVMDKVNEDLAFACANIRVNDGTKGLTVNRAVAQGFASRIMLFEGTWQKYHANNTAKAAEYLKAAKDYAAALMQTNAYSIAPSYKSLTTSEDLAGNPEIIMYRSYVENVVMHSLMSFQNTEHEMSSPSRSFVDAFLTKNGLPIHQAGNTDYKGKEYAKEIQNRDPRLADNIDEESGLRLNGVAAVYAASGYYANRYVNKDLINKPGGMSSTNTTDAPVMKLNEVMLNYIEAAAELAELGQYTLTQADFDKTINAIRDRQSTQMPHVTLAGNALKVNGVEINDPDRDATVKPIIWEIRRERRVELAYEGLRFNDLRRWGKLEYADMTKNKKLNMGAWINKADYPENAEALAKITLCDENGKIVTGNEGYIMPITEVAKMRVMADKDYLYPIPVDQITMYENHGFKLTQNPGW
ncbi:MAG: RagB/SusD family nutrient uptake outer membrane protein [Prevotella sp.]|nr:RagB/SusD family nutrient uptake outer membrane protein [Prevotella sp.]MDY5928120.1 RagB/SusD family nutrient uptake outer membrane protein [Prevotella sp.]